MPLYSPWAALVCAIAIVGALALPAFRGLDAPKARVSEVPAIDGLRGLAALGVFLDHALMANDLARTGVWHFPPVAFFPMMGMVGVCMFFMVTGYLFWGKMIAERGQPDWLALYVGRVMRIGPVFAVAVGALVLATVAGAGWHFVEGRRQVAAEVARWMSLGIIPGGPVNGDAGANMRLFGVTWSLRYEWAFYASLPLLAIGAWHRRWAAPTGLVAVIAGIAAYERGLTIWQDPHEGIYLALFGMGMTCAALEPWIRRRSPPGWLASVVGVLAAVTTFAWFSDAYAPIPASLLGLAFLCVVAGGDGFSILTSRPVRRLGAASFGIYMFHGLVLTTLLRQPLVWAWALSGPVAYWTLVLVAGLATVTLAAMAHLWVERPGIAAGRRVMSFVGARRPRPTRYEPDGKASVTT